MPSKGGEGVMLGEKEIIELEAILGHEYKKKELLVNAVTHSSFANIKNMKSNERLEFLGDSLLSSIISEKIYFDMDYEEGDLSKLRSRIVSMQPLAEIADRTGISSYLQYVGNLTDNMKADMMEAIIASIYLDSGATETRKFISRMFGETVKSMEKLTVLADSKSYLQELFSDAEIKYLTKKSGADHSPTFVATVVVNGEKCGKGQGSTKKEAEKKAAAEAIKNLVKV